MKITVINTGGTISCVGTPLAPMSAAQFAAACESLIDPILLQKYPDLQINYVTDLIFPEAASGTLDSTNLQPTDWCLMAQYILDHYGDCDGWVLLHGTDSLDFTGTALPFLLSVFNADGVQLAGLSKPVVITGSQMPMFYQGADETVPSNLLYNTDAFQNFCGAVAAAQSGLPEVCVFFHNSLFRGNRVVKTNASEFDAFSSPNYPALGLYGIDFTIVGENALPGPVSNSVSLDNAVALAAAKAQLTAITAAIDTVPVMQFNAFPAPYSPANATALIANLIAACVGQGIKGLILESYGEGNFPSGNPDHPSQGATYQALDAANASGVVIVDCTQVLAGVVNDSAYAAGAWLPAVGALCPSDMTPMAALAKLTALLAAASHNGWSLGQVKTLLQMNLLGEMISVNRQDSRINSELLVNQRISALDGSASLTNDTVFGPVLRASDGTLLWSAMSSAPDPSQMPGRLITQNDGNLVFYSRDNVALWATNTGRADGASSFLTLAGSTADHSLTLVLSDYSRQRVTKVLYPAV